MRLPPAVCDIFTRFDRCGFALYLVGGCVRDHLLGATPTDYDFATAATPRQIIALFRDCKTITTGAEFGTVCVIYQEQTFEMTTFRTESSYSSNRKPDRVAFAPSLSEDLKRRDFTINALAYHPDHGIVDLFEGRSHLKSKILHTVGSPTERFLEDHLRVLRGLRFAATLDLTIGPATHKAIESFRSPVLSQERVTREFCKLLCGKNAGEILTQYACVLALFIHLPCNKHWDGCDFSCLTDAPSLFELRFVLFLEVTFGRVACTQTSDLHEIKIFLTALKLSRQQISAITTLFEEYLTYCDNSPLLVLLNKLDIALTQQLLMLKSPHRQPQLEALLATSPCYQLSGLAIDGNFLSGHGFEGPEIGVALQFALDLVLWDKVPNRSDALLSEIEKNFSKKA